MGERKGDNRKQIEGTGDQRRIIGEENDKNDTTGREKGEERRERRNNITLKGEDLPREGSRKRTIEHIMRHELQVEADVEDAYQIRREQRGGMLIAKLKSWQQKKEILAKKSKLKDKKLYIDNDSTKKERDVQKEIAKIAKMKRERGDQVKIGYRKLMSTKGLSYGRKRKD